MIKRAQRRRVQFGLLLTTIAATVTGLLAPQAVALNQPKTPTGVAIKKQTYGVSEAAVAAAAQYPPSANFTATWKYADALKVRQDVTNTTPKVDENFPIMTDKVWIWDTWPLTNINTEPITYKGWKVIFSLVAPRDIFFGDRHWQARIGFFYSKTGTTGTWQYGGHLFPDGYSRGSREWAGTTIITGANDVSSFYTASGKDNGGINNTDSEQRLAMSKGKIHADANGVWFTGFRNHRIIAEPDGVNYQTLEQSSSGGIIYAFRDPFIFRNPADNKVYALFEGNTGGVSGDYRCTERDLGTIPEGVTVPDDARNFTGNIGLMEATNAAMTTWRLLPPLLSANCVNQQTERPHLVFHDGMVYLFTISHMFTYAPGLTGPDGVYGFVGPSLRSDYKPMNGSSLVLGNPPEAPLQQYSHEVLPNFMVQSFIDTVPTAAGGVRYGGTLSRTTQLTVDGSNSYFQRQLAYGFIPATPYVPANP
ncbi:MAG TPA: glycoside hydrolase family 68 protein [Kineosporiaceae bacterium]|nr:glycoside hydrolase family 68 protein [Kineosporiaceae bacterium]